MQVVALDEERKETSQFLTGQTYQLKLSYEAKERYQNVRFAIGFTRDDGVYCYSDAWLIEKELPDKGTIILPLKMHCLRGNILDLWIKPIEGEAYDSIYCLMPIIVDTISYKERGILSMERSWEFSE